MLLVSAIGAVALLKLTGGASNTMSARPPLAYGNVSASPCRNLLNAEGRELNEEARERFSSLTDPISEYVLEKDNGFGSPVNITDYPLTECRLNENFTIGRAVDDLFDKKQRGRLPAIPIGGATDDPQAHADRDAFDKWIHHRGPRPKFSGVRSSASVPLTPAQPTTETEADEGVVYPGIEKPSFDCAKAKTAAARLICADGELARLDGELGVAFRGPKAQISGPDKAKFVAEQLAWIKDRDKRCELIGKDNAAIEVLARSKPCMVSAIRERIALLAQTGATAAVGCHRDSDVITIQGVAAARSLELANGSVKDVWILVTDRPVCIMELPNGMDAPHEISVSRLQIIGQPPPSDTAIELTGKLSTGNITQWYAESNAINVISGRRIAAPVSAGPHYQNE